MLQSKLEPVVERLAQIWANICMTWYGIRNAINDDRKGWLICLCVLIITVVRSGLTYSFGMFVVDFEKIYHKPLAEENWIGTLSFCISLSMAPVSVAFIRALKYRGYRIGGMVGTIILSVSCLCSSFVAKFEWMFLTHSLLFGIGSSLLYMASSLVIGEYFDKYHKYHVLATSILLCGYPIGSLLFNPINAWLVTSFGWRVAFRVASGMILVSGVLCSWSFTSKSTPNMQMLNEESESLPEVDEVIEEDLKGARKCCTWAEVRARPEIVLWYVANGMSYLGFFMPFMNLAYYMKLHNIDTQRGSFALTMLSFAECVTYITSSFLGDKIKGRLVYVNFFASAALGVVCIVWPFVDVSYALIVLSAMVMGGFLGLTIVYTYAASGEVTGLPIDIAWSFTNLWSGVGILVGPFFTGAVYDVRQNYDDVFFVIGTLFLISALLFGVIPLIQHYRDRQQKCPSEVTGILSSENRQTFKIPQRSVSKGSLANDDVIEYGTIPSSELEKKAHLNSATINGHAWKP